MKSPARLGWLVAILLALSLIAPFTSPASAAQTDATPTAQPSQEVTAPEIPVPTQTEETDSTDVDAEIVQPSTDESNEPVAPAALASLKLYSKDASGTTDVPGASYTIMDSTCTSTLQGPTAADEYGVVTFTDVAEQGTQVCIVVTIVPSGYLVPDPLVIALSTDTVLTEWSILFQAAPAQLYDLPIFKEDSVTGEKIGGAGFVLYYGACPGGDFVTLEQFTGPSDAVDGSAGRTIFTGLPAGDYCVVETTVPAGYTGGGSATVSLPANTSGWTFLNDPVGEPTYDLPIFKQDSETGEPIGGAGITLYYGTCAESGSAVGPEQFTGDAAAQDGSAGRTIFTGLLAGDYCAVETTVPAGYTGNASATVNLPENTSGWTLLNTPDVEPVYYDLPIFKEDSVTGGKIGGAGFTVYYGTCDEEGAAVGPEQFTGDVDASDGSAGRTIFEDLLEGNYCVVETTVPDGYTGGTAVTVNLPENASGWTVLNDPIADTGTLDLTKRFCYVDDPDDAGTYFGMLDDISGCIFGAASFYVWPVSDPEASIGPITTSSESGRASVDLPAGDYMLQEISSGAQHEFTITAGEITDIPVWNLLYDEGSLYVTKIYCKAKYDTTDITFDYPVDVSAAGWDWGHKPKCWQGDANFEVWLYGDPNNVIVFNTGADGEVWLTLPETTDATGPHKLVETSTGAWAWFQISRGEITYATVTNYFTWYHPYPKPIVTPTPTGTGAVTTLPATGSGSDNSSSWFLLGFALIGITGLGGIALRRKTLS